MHVHSHSPVNTSLPCVVVNDALMPALPPLLHRTLSGLRASALSAGVAEVAAAGAAATAAAAAAATSATAAAEAASAAALGSYSPHQQQQQQQWGALQGVPSLLGLTRP
jgi:hypothetical protein